MRIRTLETFKMNEKLTHRSNDLFKRFERCILLLIWCRAHNLQNDTQHHVYMIIELRRSRPLTIGHTTLGTVLRWFRGQQLFYDTPLDIVGFKVIRHDLKVTGLIYLCYCDRQVLSFLTIPRTGMLVVSKLVTLRDLSYPADPQCWSLNWL